MTRQTSWLLALALAVAFGIGASPLAAQTISKAEAVLKVRDIRANHALVLNRYPRLVDVDLAIRGACGEQIGGGPDTAIYCGCASAVTMSLWLSGVDPSLIDRLRAFVAGRVTMKAEDFLRYQGPELYNPLCDLALG